MHNTTLGYIIDTGNAYLSVATSDCTNCYPNATYGNYYNPAASTTRGISNFSKSAVVDASVDMPRGAWAMLGQMATDTVCLEGTSTCVPNMDIFEVTSVYGESMYGWNGILGLAPEQNGAPPSFVK